MNIILKDDPVFKKAHNTFRKFTADEMLREKYEARMKWESDRASAIGDAWGWSEASFLLAHATWAGRKQASCSPMRPGMME